MNNKRVLLITGTTTILRAPDETDNFMEEVFDLTLPSKQRYVKKHGYDLMTLRSFGTDKKGIYNEKDVAFLRIQRPLEMLEQYDIVMWIDADALITNEDLKIENFPLEPHITFYASYDWNGKTSMSTGNFIVQNTPNTEAFANTFYSLGKRFSSEQETINALFWGSDLKHTIKPLEHKFLNAAPTVDMYKEAWATRPPIFAPWTKDAFLLHLTGCSNKHRIRMLNEYFKEYL